VNPRLWQVFAPFVLLPAIAGANSGIIRVTSIRSWSHPGETRVIVQTTGPFEYRSSRAANPDRLFFDILGSRPWIANRRYATRLVNDTLVKRVRIAETVPGRTRIVFDLTGPAGYKVSRLDHPDRMLIEILLGRRSVDPGANAGDQLSKAQQGIPNIAPRPYREAKAYARVAGEHASPFRHSFVYPSTALPIPKALMLLPAPPLDQFGLSVPAATASGDLFAVYLPGPVAPRKYVRNMSTRVIPATRSNGRELSARPPRNATRSLTRALGLKINRVVIDAGHGGHDDGTIGPHGVLEKDVVLDVALRLAALVQSRLGAEVILTRSDDTFVPLHERTAIANEHKADLFLSIHANSSPSPAVGGTETFYLNFTNSASALDVAARENAGSDKNVGELKDLIQSITLNDKITESETFARDIQTPLFTQAASANTAARDRGIKRAPFVVLIGASMPSVLAEIGFLSNARDERNLGRPEYRQKIAEALYRGVESYSRSLSHFEVASSTTAKAIPAGN
jgi:N-acetylmuramoyl-L-alanine amidase